MTDPETHSPIPAGLVGVPVTEAADIMRRLARGDLGMQLTSDFQWFRWEDSAPDGPFEIEAGGYVIRIDKDWEVVRGLDEIAAPDGRRTVWEHGWDFSPVLTADEHDALINSLRRLGHDA